MTAPISGRHPKWLLTAFVLTVSSLALGLVGSARAAGVEHQQVIAGLHGATLEARINTAGVATGCKAEYVARSEFEVDGWAAAKPTTCEPADLGSMTESVSTRARIEGLALSTNYRYRFMLTAGGETTPGPEGEFSTFGIEDFSFRTLNSAGEPDVQAGSTPYEMIVKITAPTTEVESQTDEGTSPTGTIKDLLNELPRGLIGNPTAIPRCTVRETEDNFCSGDAQVGMLELNDTGRPDPLVPRQAALFNTIPPQGTAARFAGFVNASTDGFIDSGVRTGADYGITAGGFNIAGRTTIFSVTVRLWGVPADPRHDAKRVCPGTGTSGCASTAPDRPFLRNPTSCAGPLNVLARVDAYQSPGEFDEAQTTLPAITGCNKLEFHPSLEVMPTTETAESPTGLHVDLHIPQSDNPNGLATPDLKDAVVKLPLGITVNPSSANGLEGCTPAQIGLTTPVGTTPIHTTAGPAECPDAAKVGTVEIDTPLLDHPLNGAVYIATPYENPFDSLLAIYIAVNDPISGVVIKLAGDVEIGPEGQLTTSFDENPQLPFEDFKLDFFPGPRAALKTGPVCGEFSTTSSLTPWSAPESGPPATPGSASKIGNQPGGGNCPTSADQQPNSPSFEAGSESPIAGAYSPFVLRLTREDGTQQFSSLTVTPPAGLLGKLAGIPYCSDSALAEAGGKSGKEEQASASCPAASEVGIVNVGAGAGPSPFYVQGHAYLAGPYRGAPLSLAIITPAVAGPYDLGTVVVRSALEIDPFTSQITVKSDQIPTELKGIPLDVRSIAVKMNRSNFTLNPTSCESLAVGGSVTTTVGQTATLHNGFQVGNCGNLGFKPKLNITLKGSTTRTGHPALKAVLTYPKAGAYANVARAQVNLPRSEFIEQSNLNKTCTKPVLLEGKCPAKSIYGKAKAWTPLLDKPLEGNVYLVGGFGFKLPALVAELDGQIRILLAGKVDSGPNKGIRNTFEAVPDAPVEKFELNLKGGPKYSLLVNSENLCKSPQKAIARFTAQNGKVLQTKPVVSNDCKKKSTGGGKKPKGGQHQKKTGSGHTQKTASGGKKHGK
jgi:hypothetical protein